jgi:hypothetical protein
VLRGDRDTRHAKLIPMREKFLPLHQFPLEAFDEYADPVELLGLDVRQDLLAHREAAHRFDDDTIYRLGTLGFASDSLGDDPNDPLLDDDILEFWDADSVRVQEEAERSRAGMIDIFLSRIAVHSLLTEVAFVLEDKQFHVIPYHANSLHQVPDKRDELLLVRPGRPNQRYWKSFERDIGELEALLNDSNAKERDLEALLRRNPLFLRGLNYSKVYGQVVLQGDDGRTLVPDIIAEPVGSKWCDIVELKLPRQRVLVGRDNRASLAAAIHAVVSQLREYSAFFDDRRLARAVEEKHGFSCYKPRLVAIVGRDPTDYGDLEVQRAMTAYPNLSIISWDRLIRAARSHLLL